MSHSASLDMPYIPALDPNFGMLVQGSPQDDGTTKKNDDTDGPLGTPIKAIPWPRPINDKGKSPLKNHIPIFPWDFYFCDIVVGLARIGQILDSDKRGGLKLAFPEVFDGAQFQSKAFQKCQDVIAAVDDEVLHEYTDYGRQEKGEYVRFWRAATGLEMDLELLHRRAVEKGGREGMVYCSSCELRFPGEAEKKTHEKVRHGISREEKGFVPFTPDSWKTPKFEPPTVAPAMILLTSANDSVSASESNPVKK